MGRPEELVAAVRYLCIGRRALRDRLNAGAGRRVHRGVAIIATTWPDRPCRDRSGPSWRAYAAPRGGSPGQAALMRSE